MTSKAGPIHSVAGKTVADIPELLAEWDEEANGCVSASSVTAGSNKKRYWRCAQDHTFYRSPGGRIQRGKIVTCPDCRKTVADIPKLFAEWDEEANGDISASSVTFRSKKKRYWRCAQGHTFYRSPDTRTQRGKVAACPDCRKVPTHSIARKTVTGKSVADFPQLSAEWDEEANGGISASAVTAGSNKKRYWRCAQGHTFYRSPAMRTDVRGPSIFRGRVTACPDCREGEYYTWNRVVTEAKKEFDVQGFLPSSKWFVINGRSRLISCIYRTGHTWSDLEEAVIPPGDKTKSFKSRNGLRWKSRPEASLSNFLYARGIPHDKGERYPTDYSEFSGRSYGVYDLHFQDRNDVKINVEVWGDLGVEYQKKRSFKEKYHEGRDDFLGINYRETYSDEKLTKIFEVFIDVPEPYIFDKIYDSKIETTSWVYDDDDLLAACRELAHAQPDGKLPNKRWLLKTYEYSEREGPSYTRLVTYILCWSGGFKNMRRLLGEAVKTVTDIPELIAEWDEEANGGVSASSVTVGSDKKRYWRCAQGHTFYRSPNTRIRRGRVATCPACRKTVADISDLLAEWDEEANGEISASSVTAGSGKKCYWRCAQGHAFYRSPSERARQGRVAACPDCRKTVADIAELLAEWDEEANGCVFASTVKVGSGKKCYWRCAQGHTFYRSPHARIRQGRVADCPDCRKVQQLQGRGPSTG